MSYYDPQSWQLPMREATWDQQQSSSAPSDISTGPPRESAGAFSSQLEDVERAIDNLSKSGKLFSPNSRRDSMPMMGAAASFTEFPSRLGGMGGRHHSVDFDQSRPHSGAGLQMFYANQRHQPRPNEAEQMAQAKRRMAAHRERELRNYHQEQQFHRNMSSQGKPENPMSPSATGEEDRHELIARQHRALYGKESGAFGDDGHTPRPSNSASGTSSTVGGRGPSPRTYDPFGSQGQASLGEAGAHFNSGEQNQQANQKGPSPNPQQQRSRADSTSSPASNPPGQNFAVFESAAQQSSRTSTSSPGGSPPRQGKTSAPGVAPIGTRPNQAQATNAAVLGKRAGTPSNSPLAYSFAPNESLNVTKNNNERSTSSASNPAGTNKDSNVGGWGAPGSGPWNNNNSNNKSLGVQASVWG